LWTQIPQIPQILISHRARRVLRVNKMNELLRRDRSKAPHMVRGHDALHRDRCEGFLGKKISSLILSLGAPSHKPLRRSYSASSGPRVTGERYPGHPVNPVQNSCLLGLWLKILRVIRVFREAEPVSNIIPRELCLPNGRWAFSDSLNIGVR
jgi:hypothetical protein